MEKEYELLIKWLQEFDFLKEKISKVIVFDRLIKFFCVLVVSIYGWLGNMEMIMRFKVYVKQQDFF